MLPGILILIIIVLISAIIFMQIKYTRFKKWHITNTKKLNAKTKELATIINKNTASVKDAQVKQAWFAELFYKSHNIILAFSIDNDEMPGKIIAANDAACNALEYSREELYGKSILEIEIVDETYLQESSIAKRKTPITLSNTLSLGSDSSTASRAMQLTIRRIINEKQIVYVSGYKTKNGKRIPVRITARISSYNEQPVIICNTCDITEEEQQKLELTDAKQRYTEIINYAPIGFAIFSGTRQLETVNPACLNIFGFPDKKEFINFNFFESKFIPETYIKDIKKGNTTSFTMKIDFDAAIQDGIFISSRTRSGYFKVTLHNMGHDKNYNLRGYMVTFIDITQQHEIESALHERERELQQARKMEAIGVLSGGIAHDFNNILTPILGYSQLGVELCKEGDQIHQFMSEILTSSRRAKDLVGQILTFSRQTEGTSHPISVTPIIKEVIKQTAASLPDNIKITRDLKTEDDLIMATPTQVHQILMNLCTNAVHIVKQQEDGGSIQVRLSSFVLGRHHRKEFPQLVTRGYLLEEKRQRYLRISVSDTGQGIDEETKNHIFEPFFTTKPNGEGTGMGLAVVQGIVTSLDGAISFETEEGKGTTFHVALPAVEKPEINEEKEVPDFPTNMYTILFVDDEVGIVKMAELMLKSMGYNAVVTNRSTQALEIFKQDPDKYDVLITDQVMPELTGAELTQQILDIRPDLPIILCTGFSESLTAEKAAEIGIREIIMKPIEMSELSRSINRVISSINNQSDNINKTE